MLEAAVFVPVHTGHHVNDLCLKLHFWKPLRGCNVNNEHGFFPKRFREVPGKLAEIVRPASSTEARVPGEETDTENETEIWRRTSRSSSGLDMRYIHTLGPRVLVSASASPVADLFINVNVLCQ